MSTKTKDKIDPLEVLKEDLKDDSVEVQLDAIRALPTVALALGPERTANELYDCLEKYCFPVEIQYAKSPEAYSNTDALLAKEEVLAAIAQELGPTLIEYTGGSTQTAKKMLPLLEKLAMVEETVIRQAAVQSLNNVMDRLNVNDVKKVGLGILQRLSEADWFTSRVSASALTPQLYNILNSEEDRRKILEIHKSLCNDDMPMVKNDAYKNLVLLIEKMKSHQLILAYTKPLLEQLTNELMENMRQSIVDITKKIAQKTEDEKSQDIVPSFIKAAVEDDSWRVRKHMAINLSDICKYLKKKTINDNIIPLYIKLLQDSEPQVRKETILILDKIILTTDGDSFSKPLINGPIQALASDSVNEVREALAEQVSCLGNYLNKNMAKEKLLPILKKLAADESSITRLNLCSKLSQVSKILGIELFESDILPLLKEVTIDQKWRVRNSIVQNIAIIGIQMGKDKFYNSRLKEILIQSLKDPAATVRDTASLQVKILFEKFGFDYCKKYLFTQMKSIYNDSGNYLHRMVPLKTIQKMSIKLTTKQISIEFKEVVTKALRDPISNVRFTACKVLYAILPKTDKDTKIQFKTLLTKIIKEDTDQDVIYFGKKALTQID